MSAAEEYVRAFHERLRRETEDYATRPLPGLRPVVEMRHVRLTFGKPVLENLTLTAYRGETLLVVGESGAGKSTILKLILRLLVPDRGRIRVFGREITTLPFEDALELRRHIGTVFQQAALFDSLSVYENVAYPLRENTDLRELDIEAVVRQRLEFVDLDPDQVMDQLPAELSGGMRKRVGIARAIATEPDLILYDEPTAGLDPLKIKTITELIRKLQAQLGVTSVVVTHDLRTGFRVASRVNLLRDGRITFEGTPAEMLDSDDPYIRRFLG
ncbi:MAG: ABC transporter ATP-binding protein [Gemmatimonadota bacterium]